jgi:2-iminobutanoate/2-iminopropanoate deaminase
LRGHRRDGSGRCTWRRRQAGPALAAAGSDFAHVLKVTVFLTNIADRGIVNEVRKEFFGAARPASTLIEVSALAIDGLLVEIEAVAGIPAAS